VSKRKDALTELLKQRDSLDDIRRYMWLRDGNRTFAEWDELRALHGITMDAYIDQKMGYDHE
jgi:uncharacterized protein (UPF0216 family)